MNTPKSVELTYQQTRQIIATAIALSDQLKHLSAMSAPGVGAALNLAMRGWVGPEADRFIADLIQRTRDPAIREEVGRGLAGLNERERRQRRKVFLKEIEALATDGKLDEDY